MKTYILIFRAAYGEITKASAEETQQWMEQWQEWIAGIEALGKLAGGNHLDTGGRVLGNNGLITEGPFTDSTISVLGYILVMATSYDEAVKLASVCPILAGKGNSVEVREIMAM